MINNKNYSNKNNDKRNFGFVVLTFAAGIVAGLLLAKKSGTELQKDAKKELKKLKYGFRKSFNSIDSSIKDIKKKLASEHLPEFNSKLTESFQAIKESVKDTKANFDALIKK